jgi:hypothetical protein
MDLAEFAGLLETFGADLARWPVGSAPLAIDLLQASPAAMDLFAAATAEDMAVFGDGKPADPEWLKRVLDAAASDDPTS